MPGEGQPTAQAVDAGFNTAVKAYLSTSAEGKFSYSKDAGFLAVTWQLWEKVQRKAAFTTKTSCGFLQVDKKSKITQTSLAELSITTKTAPSQALKPCLKYSPAKSMTQMHVNIKTFRSITTVLHLGAVPIYSFWIWA